MAEADLERTRTQLKTSAENFARDFDQQLAQVHVFFSHLVTLPSGEPTAVADTSTVPRMVADAYYLDISDTGPTRRFRLQHDGKWSASIENSAIPDHVTAGPVQELNCEPPPAGGAPVVIILSALQKSSSPLTSLRRCMYVVLDTEYLRGQLFPALIDKYFGHDARSTYAFTVERRGGTGPAMYSSDPHPPSQYEVQQPFFALRLEDLVTIRASVPPHPPPMARLYVNSGAAGRIVVRTDRRFSSPLSGDWQLNVASKAGSLASSLTVWRRQNLLLSIAVELMLLAGMIFIVVSSRRMQRLADQKMQFVAGVSHELRNPLSAICMLSRNQADGLVSGPEQVRQYGSLIHGQGQRLTEMVEQTLQFAGIHSRPPGTGRTSVDVKQVVEQALGSRHDELDRGGFETTIDIEENLPPVLGDARALQQAVENLLGNATKYSGSGRWIRVSARLDTDGKAVSITVEDHGVGIDPADAGQIFEPFYRGKSAVENQIPGTGLGLSLVRSTVEAHRGTVTLESAPGQGSAFTLHLPVAPGGK